MLENHFLRLNMKGKTFSTPIESVVYNLLPMQQLTTKSDVCDGVIAYLKRNQEESPFPVNKINYKYVSEVLDDLVRNGFVQEVIGIQLEKILEKVRR